MNSVQILHENGMLVLKGPMTQADVRNRNGRIYPKAVLRTAVMDLAMRVSGGSKTPIYSELEHPNYEELIFEKSCGMLTEVSWDEATGIAYCKVQIHDSTPMGREVLEGVANGVTYGISTRGSGSLNEANIVQNDLKFFTADVIKTIQSCQICRLTEGVESVNTLDDYLVEASKVEPECKCRFNQLTLAEQIQVKHHLAEAVISCFKK